MLRRLTRRLNATFRGPSPLDTLAEIRALAPLTGRVAALEAEVARLRAVAEPFHTRPGTLDPNIYAEVLVGNEYRLPERFEASDVVIDVGAHVGSFAAACLLRGAGRVVSFEPVPANHALLGVNLARFGGRGEARRAAVWRSDVPATELRYALSDDPTNTGGGNVLAEAAGGLAVPAVPLDAVVAELLAATGQGRVRLLKLDCEGSEYPVLLTATCLDKVAELCGEYHDIGEVGPAAQARGHTRYDRKVLVDYLSGVGFRVESEVHPRNPAIGLFWARRG